MTGKHYVNVMGTNWITFMTNWDNFHTECIYVYKYIFIYIYIYGNIEYFMAKTPGKHRKTRVGLGFC